jgi:hypothetical protein
MGLLDELMISPEDKQRAQYEGLLSMGLGMLANNTSKDFMPAFAKGGVAGMQQYKQSLGDMRQQKMQDFMLKQKVAEMEKAQQQQELQAKFLANPAIPETIRSGIAAGMINPADLMKPQTMAEGSQLVSPFLNMMGQNGTLAQGPAKAPKIGTEDVFTNGMWQKFPTSDGMPDLTKPIGSPFARGKDASSVSVVPKIEVKMGESVAGQIGPMMKDARVSADGAVKMFDSADRIEKAIDSGMVSAGPLTSLTMPVKQFFAGSTDNVRQTRQVIKSLAQMAVEARKQLAGQGQVTESEAAAVAKADAGDINDLTVGELKDLVTLTKRAAHFTAKSYSEQLGNLGSNEGTKNLVPFYNVRGMEPLIQHQPKLPQIGGNDGWSATVVK